MRVRLTIGAVLAAVALAGCGSDKTSGSPAGLGPAAEQRSGEAPKPADKPAEKSDDGLAGIVEASRKAGTAKMAGSTEVDLNGQRVTLLSAEGAIDFANKRSKVVNSMTDIATGEKGSGTTVIVDGDTAYLSYTMGGQPGPWMKFDLKAMVGERGIGDMGSYMMLMAGITESSRVGSETVRGAETTHYKVTVDPNKILERYPELRDLLEALLKTAENVVPGSTKGVVEDTMKPTQYDLWVGQGGLIHRIAQDLKVTGEDGKEITGRTMSEFYDYGNPVDITAPTVN